ncbi:MAG: hypothetical protein HY052_05095 [Proteobacteria bacterium]|nr:hypothetical protein [Pseudomonadota bacterium]
MPNQIPETITKYEVLFALRTGVTVMLPKVAAFGGGDKVPLSFKVSPDDPRDILIKTATRPVVLKDLKKEHVASAVSQGFIMFYEMEDDEIVRSTLCHYQGD